MRIAARAWALGKKTTLIATAFVLAVSTLTAAVPFVLSQRAGALGPVAEVSSEAELVAAAADANVTIISVKKSFNITQEIVFSGRSVYIDGNAYTIGFTGDTSGWNGTYVFQAYQINFGIKNLTITGGDVALLANGSTVNLEGTIKLRYNEFGGIEVSQGANVSRPAILNVGSATLTNPSEAPTKPTAWIDEASTVSSATKVNGPFTETTHVGNDQKQYYLNAANTGTVATNKTKGLTYASLQAAFDGASTNDLIELNKNVDVAAGAVANVLRTKVTFDGKGYAITTLGARGNGGEQKNAGLIIESSASGSTIQNLTLKGIGGVGASHGIVVFQAEGVQLKNITGRDNAAAVIVNGAKVSIDTITTSSNAWYAVNVDKPGAELTISGANTHTESVQLYVDKELTGSIVTNGLYHVKEIDSKGGLVYVLGSVEAPVINTAPIYVKSGQVSGLATWTHSGSGVEKFEYREYRTQAEADADVDGKTASYWTPQSVSTTRSQVVGHSWTGEQTLYYRVVAIDAAGNRSAPSALGTVVIDKKAPTVILPADSGRVSGGTFELRGTVTDTYGISEYKYQILDASGNQLTGSIASEGYSRDGGTSAVENGVLANVPIAALPDGTYTIRVWAFDTAGNRTGTKNAPHITSFTIDRDAPAISSVTYSTVDPTRPPVVVTIVADEPINTPAGWTAVNGSTTVFEKTVSANESATVAITDFAGNPGSFAYDVVNINTDVRGAISPVATNTTVPVISGVLSYDVDGAGVEGVDLDVYVDGELTEVTTNTNGFWTLGTVLVANGVQHSVAVYFAGADPDTDTALDELLFTTNVPVFPPTVSTPELNQPGPVTVTDSAQPNGGLPLTTFGAAQILGASTQIPASSSEDTNQDVQGATTDDIIAQALNATNNTDGSVFGLAWYWWLAIIGGAAVIIWGVASAIRGRQS
jgi:hypothetical protein